MKGRSRANSRLSSVYSATPSAPVTAMTIAGLTPAAPYSSGSARISAYQMGPSPRRLAIRRIRRGRVKEAPRLSLRHRPYSAASIRAMNVLSPMRGTASRQRTSARLRNCESFVASRARPARSVALSSEPGERRRDQALRRARRVPEIQGRLGELQFQQARGAAGIADQIHARIQQCTEGQRREHPLRDAELIRPRLADRDFLGCEQRAGWCCPERQQRALANRMAEAPADVDHGGLAMPIDALEVGLQQDAAPRAEEPAHVREHLRD